MRSKQIHVLILFGIIILVFILSILKFGFGLYQYDGRAAERSKSVEKPKPYTPPPTVEADTELDSAPGVDLTDNFFKDEAVEILKQSTAKMAKLESESPDAPGKGLVSIMAESGDWTTTAAKKNVSLPSHTYAFTVRTQSGQLLLKIDGYGSVLIRPDSKMEVHQEKGKFEKLVLLKGAATIRFLKSSSQLVNSRGIIRNGPGSFHVSYSNGTLRGVVLDGEFTYKNKKGSYDLSSLKGLKATSRKKKPVIVSVG